VCDSIILDDGEAATDLMSRKERIDLGGPLHRIGRPLHPVDKVEELELAAVNGGGQTLTGMNDKRTPAVILIEEKVTPHLAERQPPDDGYSCYSPHPSCGTMPW
jgi:hypothetical protein